MIFSPTKYSQLKSRLRSRYKKNYSLILKDLKKLKSREISDWVYEHGPELKDFSSPNWLFLSQLQLFNYFHRQDPLLGKNHFGPKEEIVFEKWNNSEFAEEFLRTLNKGHFLGKASVQTLKIFDKHLVTFGERQILKNDNDCS
jgi:hypothetical protein